MQLAHTITPEVVGWGRQGKNKLQPLRSKVSWKCLLSTTSTENVLLPWSYRWSLLHESLYYLFVCMFCFDRDEIWNWKKGIWEGGGGGAGRGGAMAPGFGGFGHKLGGYIKFCIHSNVYGWMVAISSRPLLWLSPGWSIERVGGMK